MAGKPCEWRAVHVRREVRPDRIAPFFPHVLGAALRVEFWHFVRQDLDLSRGELTRKEQVALSIELCELGLGELHGIFAIEDASGPAACQGVKTWRRWGGNAGVHGGHALK